MSPIVGSMSKKTPKYSPKGRGRKEEEVVPPYTPKKVKINTQCFVDAQVLGKKGMCLLKGKF